MGGYNGKDPKIYPHYGVFTMIGGGVGAIGYLTTKLGGGYNAKDPKCYSVSGSTPPPHPSGAVYDPSYITTIAHYQVKTSRCTGGGGGGGTRV